MKDIMKRFWDYSGNHKGAIKMAIVFSFIRSVFGLPQLMAIVYAVRALTGEISVENAVPVIVVLTFVCIAGNFAASYLEQWKSSAAGFLMTADKRISLGNMLRRLPLGFFSDFTGGRVVSVLTTTMGTVEMGASGTMIGIVSGFINTALLFAALCFFEWRIAVITGIGMFVYLFCVGRQMKISEKYGPDLRTVQGRLSESALTFLQGIKVIKSFSFDDGSSQLKKAVDDSKNENLRLTRKEMPFQYASTLSIAFFESLILVAAFLLYRSGEIEAVKTVTIMIFSFIVYSSLNQAGSAISVIGMLDSGLIEVSELSASKEMEIREPAMTMASNEIVFDHVSFAYDDSPVLDKVSTVIKPDSFTAIIGPSGSGKSTICQLIARFRDVTSGSISIGGADVRNIEYSQLMKNISMVFQKVYLFEDTILNNIRFGKPDATLWEVREAARAARCDDFIMSLPEGYDTVVEEGGSSFSGGEKQRISIARAILKDSPIIILDEATSALDAENEHEILEAIDELTRNKTVIMIAHRIKSVKKADHIIAVKDGRIVQEGTHDQLISIDGLYRDFINVREKAVDWTLGNA